MYVCKYSIYVHAHTRTHSTFSLRRAKARSAYAPKLQENKRCLKTYLGNELTGTFFYYRKICIKPQDMLDLK